jgi:3-methyladenine DNA glycosylase AlkD
MDKSLIQRKTEILELADKPKEFTKALQELLQLLVNTDATKNYKRIIPDTGKFYGVPKPILWVIASEIRKFIKTKPEQARGLLETIWTEGSYEARQISGKSLEQFSPENPRICLDFVSSVLPDIDNWSICDCLAMYAVEPLVFSSPELVILLSEEWIQSTNKWIRRFGVVTLRGYKKIKANDKIFELLDMVMEDEERDVKKAAAWILREITKGNPDEVSEFLHKWAKAKPNKDARWIIENGMIKLSNDEQRKISGLLG